MARIYIRETDELTRTRKLAGWYDEANLALVVKEASDWDGRSHRGRSSGMQINRQELLLTAGGRWVLETDRRPEYDGRLDHEFITADQAHEWLLVNDHEDIAKEHFGDIPDERPSLRMLGEQRQAADAAFKAAVLEQVKPGGESESDAARWGGVSRTTIRKWLGKD